MAKKNETTTALVKGELKPQVSVLNLESGKEEKVTFAHAIYKVDGELTPEVQKQVLALLGTPGEMVEAICKYATSQAYQVAKKTALASGSYLTKELRAGIIAYLSSLESMKDLGASEIFERWKTGYLANKPGAIKVLQIVRESQDIDF